MTGARRIGVFGRLGAGKTARVMALVEKVPQVVAFDPMDKYGRRSDSFVRIRKLPALRDAIRKARAGAACRIAFVPSDNYPQMLLGLAELLWPAQSPEDEGRITLVVEEMALVYPFLPVASVSAGMPHAVLQGRHRRIEIIGVSRHPSLVSMEFLANCAETYALPQAAKIDIAALCQVHGREHAEKLSQLTPNSYLRFAKGEVTCGKDPGGRK